MPAVEILVATPIVQKLIFEGRTRDLKTAIQNGEAGMQTFNQCLLKMVEAGTVTKQEALRYVDNIPAFERMLKGGASSGDTYGLVG